MKLRQKLAMVLAATMVVTAVPVTTMAASTNRITKTLTVAKDTKIGYELVTGTTNVVDTTKDNAPRLIIDLTDDLTTGSMFFIKIADGEFADVTAYGTSANGYTVERLAGGKELQVTVGADTIANTTDLSIPLYATAKGAEVAVEVISEGSSVSEGKYIIARTNEAKGTVAIGDTTTLFDNGSIADITIEEAYAGAFKSQVSDDDNNSATDKTVTLTLTLENGDFDFVAGTGTVTLGRGFTNPSTPVTVNVNPKDKQVATITLKESQLSGNARGNVVVKGLKVDATTKTPSTGDLNVSVEGKLVEDKAYKVATVSDFGTSLKMKDDKAVEIVAGQVKEVKFSLEENVDDSLTKRTVEFKLDNGYLTTGSNIKVTDNNDTTADKTIAVQTTEPDASLIIEKIDGVERVVGFEMAITELQANKKDKFDVTFEKVSVPVDFKGDIKVTAEGRAIGEELEVVALTAKAPVEVKTEAAVLKVGLKEQKAGKVVITETEKAMLAKGKTLVFDLADEDGIEFTGKPEVKVTSGDLVLGDFEIKTIDKKEVLVVEVKRASKEASTIEISNFGVKLDRTVPQGKYDLKIGGEALTANKTALTVEDFFIVGTPNTEDITNGMRKGTAQFVNAATTYTVNGEVKEMDAAAFISKAGRMMLPVRYVSEAFGIDGNNVIFADGTVTILAGTRTLQVKNGSDIAVLNGAQIKMAEKVVITNGRTYVPVGEVGRLLGVSVSFDNATKTATFENK